MSENNLKHLAGHSQIEAIMKSIKQQLAAIYAFNVKDDLKM